MDITKTGIKRKFLVWFFSISITAMALLSGVLKISDSVFDSYSFVTISIVLGLLGSKGFDNKNKTKIKLKDMEVKGETNE